MLLSPGSARIGARQPSHQTERRSSKMTAICGKLIFCFIIDIEPKCQSNLPQISSARGGIRVSSRTAQSRQEQTCDDRDDRNHDKSCHSMRVKPSPRSIERRPLPRSADFRFCRFGRLSSRPVRTAGSKTTGPLGFDAFLGLRDFVLEQPPFLLRNRV